MPTPMTTASIPTRPVPAARGASRDGSTTWQPSARLGASGAHTNSGLGFLADILGRPCQGPRVFRSAYGLARPWPVILSSIITIDL